MTNLVVVGIDGSDGANRAFGWAVGAAGAVDADVQPVHVWTYPTVALLPYPVGLPVPPVEAMQADAEMRAAGLVEALGADSSPKVLPPIVRQGAAGHVLCDVAEDAGLLVVGSRGLGSIKGALLGSVGSHCIAAAPCPVALVPDNVPEPPSGLVVVGVDGSEGSLDAVRWADAWAPATATMLLVHAWSIPVTLDSMNTALDVEAIEGAGEAALEAAANEVSGHTVETLCVQGDPRNELARLGKAADMVVLGANGHNPVHRFLLGSVSHNVAHHLVAPTVIVRPVS
jgi:nucleotide-binding universal stress UspA family protein